MCELQLSSDVTDSVDTVNIRAHPVINVDSSALGQLHAGVFQAVALGARSKADGNHATVHGQGVLLGTILGLNFNGDVVAIVLD